jgi:hypothetical protein
MSSRKLFPPSPAMVVACVALAVALGGTTYAATALPRNSVGTPQLKKNAVISSKVRNNAIRGADVKESTFSRVPTATTAGSANAAFSIYHEPQVALPTGGEPILVLSVPKPGNYVLTATFTAVDSSATPGAASCQLWAGVDGDGVATRPAGTYVELGHPATMALQLPFHFVGPGHAQLICQDLGEGDVRAQWTTITAMQVAQLTSVNG